MNTDQHPPDPARVAIVQRITLCTEQKAAKAIRHLDNYDMAQQIPSTNLSTEKHGRFARLPELLPTGKAALIQAGYSRAEAATILETVFTSIASEEVGKRMYLPKVERIKEKIRAMD